MALPSPGQLNLDESPSWGSRSVDCFEKIEQIGEGTYGQVYMAREKATGDIVALKKVRMDNEKEGFPITAIREIKILKKLQHENVIKLKEIVTSKGPEKEDNVNPGDPNKFKGSIFLVFEYMDHDLTGLSDRPGMRFTVPQIKCYMKQLLTGLHYCHVNQILHRDIKGSNLLIDNCGNLKLADFGLARTYINDQPLTNRVITLWYRPPELLLGSTRYSPAVDMWSVGCIFAELIHGKPILPGKHENEQLTKIWDLCGYPSEENWPGVSKLQLYDRLKPDRHKHRRVKDVFKHFDRHALDLLERMLTLDPHQRITAKDALDADYFWTDPFPCAPNSLPQYKSSHEYQTKKERQQQRQLQEEASKRHKSNMHHLPPQNRVPHQQSLPLRPAPSQPSHMSTGSTSFGTGQMNHHYGNARPMTGNQGRSQGISRPHQPGAPNHGSQYLNRGAVTNVYGVPPPLQQFQPQIGGYPLSGIVQLGYGVGYAQGVPYGGVLSAQGQGGAQQFGAPIPVVMPPLFAVQTYMQQYVDIDGAYNLGPHAGFPLPPASENYRQQQP